MHSPGLGFPRWFRAFRASHLLCVMLGTTTLMAAACGADPAPPFHRGSGSGAGAGADPATGGDGKATGTTPSGGGYDPQTPTNKGPGLNPAGFAAVVPIMQAHCSECHHPGTWLDLESGADASTAAKMIHAIEAGTMPPAPRAAPSADELAKIKAWSSGQIPAVSPADIDPPSVAVAQLLDASTLATYQAALPKVGWTRLVEDPPQPVHALLGQGDHSSGVSGHGRRRQLAALRRAAQQHRQEPHRSGGTEALLRRREDVGLSVRSHRRSRRVG